MFKPLPSQKYLKECFDYDPESGVVTWKKRPRLHFQSDRIWLSFNAKHAGKEAFTMRDTFGYRRGKVSGSEYVSQRIVWKYMTGQDPSQEIDHVNGIRDDNRWCNLRCVSHSDNMKNTRKRSDNKTGVSGVTIKGGRFCARVQSNGQRRHLGYFQTLSEAEAAVINARQKMGLHSNHGNSVVRLV